VETDGDDDGLGDGSEPELESDTGSDPEFVEPEPTDGLDPGMVMLTVQDEDCWLQFVSPSPAWATLDPRPTAKHAANAPAAERVAIRLSMCPPRSRRTG
jgi:hypothetical protein